MKKKMFNAYQEALIKAAMKEEQEKDIRVNAAEPQELTRLYNWYLEAMDGNGAIYNSILRLLDFWSCYFSCGREEAERIRDEEHEALMIELQAECAEIEQRLLYNGYYGGDL